MGLPTSDTDVELWSDESKIASFVYWCKIWYRITGREVSTKPKAAIECWGQSCLGLCEHLRSISEER